MVQMAWTFVNDSLCTTLSLQWEPEVIAVALMYLAGKLSKFEVVDWVGRTNRHLRWWDMFVEDITMDLLEDICHQVLDLYSQPQNQEAPDSPPLVRNPLPQKDTVPIAAPLPFVGAPQHTSPAVIPPAVAAPKGLRPETKASTNGEKIPTVTGGVVSDSYQSYSQPLGSSSFPPAFSTTRPLGPPQYPPPFTNGPPPYYPPAARPPPY